MTGTPLDERGLPLGYPFKDDWEITPREYRRRRDAGEPIVLVDCRTAAERDLATIPGAIHVPLHDLANQVDDLREHEVYLATGCTPTFALWGGLMTTRARGGKLPTETVNTSGPSSSIR